MQKILQFFLAVKMSVGAVREHSLENRSFGSAALQDDDDTMVNADRIFLHKREKMTKYKVRIVSVIESGSGTL